MAQANTFNKAWYGPTSDGTAPAPVADNGVNIFRSPEQLWWGMPRGTKLATALNFQLSKDQIALNLQNSIYARPAFMNATGNGQDAWMNLSYGGFADQLAQGAGLNTAFANIDTENPDLSAFAAAGGKVPVETLQGLGVPRTTLGTLIKRGIVQLVEEPAEFTMSALKARPSPLDFQFNPAQQDAPAEPAARHGLAQRDR